MSLACLRFWIETPVRYGELLEESGLLGDPESFRLRHELFALPGPRVHPAGLGETRGRPGQAGSDRAGRQPREVCEAQESTAQECGSRETGSHNSGASESTSQRSAAEEALLTEQRRSHEPGSQELPIRDCESQPSTREASDSREPQSYEVGGREPSSRPSPSQKAAGVESERGASPRFQLLLDLLQFRAEDVLLQVCDGWLVLRAEHGLRFDGQGLCSRRVTRAHALPDGVRARDLRALLCHDGILVVETVT